MWKDYSSGYIKNNRPAGLAVRVAALISALLLSLLLSLFYNAWKYEVERIELEEGGWHSRFVGELSEEKMEAVRNFAHVEKVVANEKGYRGTEPTTDIYFGDKGAVFSETPRIAQALHIPRERVIYNYELLAMYLIRDESDTAPRLLFPLFILITLAASFSLIVIIHNSFAVSMNARVHQFGIFSSIGATPGQIRACLLQEAAALCAGPVIVGDLLGIALGFGLLQMVNILLGSGIEGRHAAVFGYHPLVLGLTLLVTVVTIWISAWLPARKLSKLTPLEAIRNTGELQLKRRKKSRLLSLLFGVEGELAGNALKAQKKALRTASLSLVCAFLAFSVMQCFFCLSQISTRETYFERYQGVWDLMVTLRDTDIERFGETASIQGLDGVESAIVYQRANAKRLISEDEISEELKSLGGFAAAPAKDVSQAEGGWLVNAPIVIMDDASFGAYCEGLGIAARLDGAVILNQIRDVTDPDFRHPAFMPYIRDDSAVSALRRAGDGETAVKIPVLAYAQDVPALREEYAKIDYYELVHFIPVSLWEGIRERLGAARGDSYICVRGRQGATLEELNGLQADIERLLGGKYAIVQENRIQEYETNAQQIRGVMAVFGGFCALLALIGIGNVLSNTLGFVRQRKREFARYMSVGLTPGELKKMFCVEALVIAGRPILASIPITVVAVGFLLRASYMELDTFLTEEPFIPILMFMLAIMGCVALAYGLAWRGVRNISLAEVLRDDTMI